MKSAELRCVACLWPGRDREPATGRTGRQGLKKKERKNGFDALLGPLRFQEKPVSSCPWRSACDSQIAKDVCIVADPATCCSPRLSSTRLLSSPLAILLQHIHNTPNPLLYLATAYGPLFLSKAKTRRLTTVLLVYK
jgi:hypothetical protein